MEIIVTDQKKNAKNWYWPRIENLDDAIEASKSGFIVSLIFACVTAAFATQALYSKDSYLGVDAAWAYIGCAIFLIVAWRIKKYSRVFAVLGTLLYVVEKIILFQSQGAKFTRIFFTIMFLLMFITGIRGVFAYHKFSKDSD